MLLCGTWTTGYKGRLEILESSLGQHVVGQLGTPEVQRAVLAMQDGRIRVLNPWELRAHRASHLMCMRFSSMLQGVWGVTGTGIPCFCREKGSGAEPARRESQPLLAPPPAGISPDHAKAQPMATSKAARSKAVSLTNIGSHHEGHLNGDIRHTALPGGERPTQPRCEQRQSLRTPHEPN